VGFVDEMAPAEMSATTGLTEGLAGRRLSLGAALASRFPRLRDLVLAGELAGASAQKVVDACAGLDPEACAHVDASLATRLVGMDPARVARAARDTATRVAADQVAAQHLALPARREDVHAVDARKPRGRIALGGQTLDLVAVAEHDPALIEQVLINLCKNSLEAMNAQESARICLSAETDGRGNTVIKVIDNGRGIPDEVAERIFIPFFTTKQGGSGIGLSLSRQIMRLHKGNLIVGSTLEGETVFTLRF